MPSTWMRVGSVALAVGVLAALVVNAGMSSGCGSSRAAPEAVKEQPPRSGADTAASTAAPGRVAAPPPAPSGDDDIELMGASKSGIVIRRGHPAPATSATGQP